MLLFPTSHYGRRNREGLTETLRKLITAVCLGLNFVFSGRSAHSRLILYLAGKVKRMGKCRRKCLHSKPIATQRIFLFDFISGSFGRASISRHFQRQEGGLGSCAKQTARV